MDEDDRKRDVASQQRDEATRERDAATEEQRFVEDLVTRGEAAERDEAGHLPRGATHEIIEKRADGVPKKVVRRRFAAF